MDPNELETLVQRLVANPHDEDALAYAHEAGGVDPKAYALLLERVGNETEDPGYASHWLSEAANVWLTTLGDAHRAARAWMGAIDKDPTSAVAADRLAQLYRDKGEAKALAALLERRAKALTALLQSQPELRTEVAAMHEEVGRLWSEPPLSTAGMSGPGGQIDPKKRALDSFRRAIELDPTSQYAIFHARELLKTQGQWDEALGLYEAELALEQDPGRRAALLRDQAQAHRAAGDLPGVTRTLQRARELDDQDPALQQELAASVLERMQAGEDVDRRERTLATELLVGLAEAYEAEHGLAYAGAALDVDAGHDRALQLFAFHARTVGQEGELSSRYLAYVEQSPVGAMATEARQILAVSYEHAGLVEEAIAMLEPLRAHGDPATVAKLDELYGRARGAAAPAAAVSSAPHGRSAPAAPSSGGSAGSVPPPSFEGPPAPSAESSFSPGPPVAAGNVSGASWDAPGFLSNPANSATSMPPSQSREARDSRGTRDSIAPQESRDSAMSFAHSEAPRRERLPADKLQGILDAAQMLAGKGKKPEAFAKYKEILDTDAAHPEALAWVEDYLRTKRDYAQLRDVLLASVRASASLAEGMEGRKERLREVAGLCEGNLRDVDGAIAAWKQLLAIDRADESARQSLGRLLERTQRWDDLANLLEQEATVASDIDAKIVLEKKLAALNENKRKDFGAAADAWARIARLAPDDDRAIATSARLYEKAGMQEQAAQVIAEHATSLEDPVARGSLQERLGELREQLADLAGAGDAYAEAADAHRSARLWEAAERCFVAAERWDRAANAAVQRAGLAGDSKSQAAHFARAADMSSRAGNEAESLTRLEQATELDPTQDEYAAQLTDRYTALERWEKLTAFFALRGDRLGDRAKRVNLRRQAAVLYATRLGDKEAAREQWLKVLEDGDDREALERLVDFAVEREDHTEAATLLRRLGNIAIDKADKARVALREAELLADGVGDVDTAIVRYETILSDLDATCRPALQAIADLQENRDNPGAAADALERELKLVADPVERGQIAARLARLYETLDDPRSAIRALDVVRKANLDDFEALSRLALLCERVEQWDRVAELLALQIEVESEEAELSAMTKKLAMILADRLDRGDEALAALTELADRGDATLRQTYVELGDRLGWKGIVASKLVEWWFEARNGSERTTALRGAFDRFAEVGRDQDATRVAIEIVRARGADRELALRLEQLAAKTNDYDALATAHDLLARELAGAERAVEMVRQAEVLARAGVPRQEALQHGEGGLANVAIIDAEPLLERLAALAERSSDVIELYERQVSRSRAPADRVRALARAAQVASARAQSERARGFLELALAGSPSTETVEMLEQFAADGDREVGGDKLRRALGAAMSVGGGGARDGGRTRSALLRRAATLMFRDLKDVEQAFVWLGDALIAHVDDETLSTVEQLADELGDARRAEQAFSRALSEVFDGPLVRLLLARRARIRRERLGDKPGAAADLKKLHDLSPSDHGVLEELSNLLRELGDHRGLVQLYEDQILRGKDMAARADLAVKVARMWEEQLQDPREAADAWRRVLRLRPRDEEAVAGLDRAKANLLRRPDAGTGIDSYAPAPPSISPSRPPAQSSPPHSPSAASVPPRTRRDAPSSVPPALDSPSSAPPPSETGTDVGASMPMSAAPPTRPVVTPAVDTMAEPFDINDDRTVPLTRHRYEPVPSTRPMENEITSSFTGVDLPQAVTPPEPVAAANVLGTIGDNEDDFMTSPGGSMPRPVFTPPDAQPPPTTHNLITEEKAEEEFERTQFHHYNPEDVATSHGGDDDVLIADDLAEMLDDEDDKRD